MQLPIDEWDLNELDQWGVQSAPKDWVSRSLSAMCNRTGPVLLHIVDKCRTYSHSANRTFSIYQYGIYFWVREQFINYNYYLIYSWAAPSTSVSLSVSSRDIIFHIILKFEQVLISHRNIIAIQQKMVIFTISVWYPHEKLRMRISKFVRISVDVDAELRHTSAKYTVVRVDFVAHLL